MSIDKGDFCVSGASGLMVAGAKSLWSVLFLTETKVLRIGKKKIKEMENEANKKWECEQSMSEFRYTVDFSKNHRIVVCTSCPFHQSHTHYISDDVVELHYDCLAVNKEHELFDVKPEWCPLKELKVWKKG